MIDNYEVLLKEYGWTFWDLQCVPIPVYIMLVESMGRRYERELKAQKEASKKAKSKKGR